MKRESLKRDIAIIGTSCLFQDSNNSSTFWENLVNGNELIKFYTDQELLEDGIEAKTIENPKFVKVKTFIDGSDAFDYSFFGYTKDEANSMDPQTRILHQLVWEAFEDSSYNPFKIQEKVGVYLTAHDNFNWIAHTMINKKETIDPFYLSQLNNKNFCSSLISYNLNLKGPSIFMDTACSSSLVAIHTACRALLLRECSMAVAGGIGFKTTEEKGYFYEEGMISSKDGHCRAFDNDSSGTVGTEGGGVVLLKRLEDAIKDNDHIYAIIRATSVNNDGNRKVGYTAPSVSGQSDCIKQALNFANIANNEISYIETHGTGTKLGDPIEIEALNKAFNYDTSFECAIGAVKSNLGHLGNAAGIAGIIKTALALKNKTIPPSLHYTKANSEISFDKGPFFVNTQATPWESKNNLPRIAGVSSLGIGGTNAHAILEGYNEEHGKIKESKSKNNILTYSAKKSEALDQYFTKLKSFLQENNTTSLSDVSYSLNTGRAGFDYRNFIVFDDREELLSELDNKKGQYKKVESQEVVFVFPGQGSQYFKMGEQLYHQEEGLKRYIDEGFGILNKKFNINFFEILGYYNSESVDPELINETQYTQPLLFIIEYALAKWLIELGVKPSLMIGHSLGEYVAACISGVFSFEEGILLIAERAFLMNKAPVGKMIAVNSSFENIQKIIPDTIAVAAINSDKITVLSGKEEDINEFFKILNENNISSTFLKTSHAFHSYLMDDIATEFENLFSGINLSKPQIPYISNLTGKVISESEATSSRYWKNQMLNTVLFEKGIENTMSGGKGKIFIEIGIPTLTNSIKRNKSYRNDTVIQLLRKSDDNSEQRFFNQALGELWQSGLEIDWTKYYENKEGRKIPVPTYAFEKNKLDFHVNPFKRFVVGDNPASLDFLYKRKWKESALGTEKKWEKGSYIVFSDTGILSENIIEGIKNRKYHWAEAKKSDFLKEDQGIDIELVKEFFSQIEKDQHTYNQIIFNWDIQDDSFESMLSVFSLFNVISKFLIFNDRVTHSKITVLGKFNDMESQAVKNKTLLSSFNQLYVCAQENENIYSSLLDISSDLSGNEIIDEIEYNFSNPVVAYKDGQRYVPFYERISLEKEKRFDLSSKVILIIGGAGKIGKTLTQYFYNQNAKVIIVGRKNVKDLDEEIKIKLGDKIAYYSSNISNWESFNATIHHIEENHGKINGVLNLAGNPSPESLALVENLDLDVLKEQFSSKIEGIQNLYKAFVNKNPEFVWVTSSLSSILGGQTFGAYSVSNSYMDYFITEKSDLKSWKCINLDGVSENGINGSKLIKIFEATIFSQVDDIQVITSLRNPNHYLLYDYKTINNRIETDPSANSYHKNKEYIEPTSPTEMVLCDLFNTFFEPKKVGITDNFFELGGDSLKAMTILKNINKKFDLKLTPQDLYTSPTIKELALHIDMVLYVSQSEASPENNTGRQTIII
ncbi:type I polyketide synthase [Chryseobacterium sp. LAM-KRS1]|uniref:type I polyketide synthase n=1 Tax=Chryseobacterium sp. LAM-KRS1 TaxID=2715754 RepID=UPI001557E1A5|nr:type I polyketide synthase [Chryseobacterium sp. LAM-KRS1]